MIHNLAASEISMLCKEVIGQINTSDLVLDSVSSRTLTYVLSPYVGNGECCCPRSSWSETDPLGCMLLAGCEPSLRP